MCVKDNAPLHVPQLWYWKFGRVNMAFWFNRPCLEPGVTTGPSPTDKRRALQQQTQQAALNNLFMVAEQ